MSIIILGSTGFLGKNLKNYFKKNKINAFYTNRFENKPNEDEIYFDLAKKSSWENILNLKPNIIINCIAYGVVKDEIDLKTMYNINYFLLRDFFTYINTRTNLFWLQVGTAFEYDLNRIDIDESTPCSPNTHYGISKLLMSNFLLQNFPKENYMILRPFGMFGPYESESKIFPMLINAQIRKVILNLSPGTQLRDYFFINDLVIFISTIIKNVKGRNYPNLINIGSNNFLSFIEYSELLKLEINNFDPNYWNWGSIKFREDDLNKFYSNSNLCFQYGFKLTPLNVSFKETYLYYKNIF